MNFFDIRKLQAALSQIKVGFLRAGVEIDDITLQKIFALAQGAAPVTPATFTSEDLSMDLNAVAPVAQSFVANRNEIITAIQDVLVKTLFSGSVNGSIDASVSVDGTNVLSRIAEEVISVFKEKPYIAKVVAAVFGSISANTSGDDLINTISVGDIEAVAPGADDYACDVIIVEDKESVNLITGGSKNMSGRFALAARAPGIELFDINGKVIVSEKTKIIAVSDVIADAFDAVVLEIQSIEADIKAKFIANIVDSSTLAGAINVGFTQQTNLRPSAVLYMLMSLGVESVITSRASESDSGIIEMNVVNIKDEFRKLGVNNDSSVNAPSTLKASFTITSKNEVTEKEPAHVTPDIFKAGTTIYALVDQDSANAIISMFQLFFGTQVQVLSNTSGVRNVMDEEIEGQISAEVSVPSAGVLEKEIINITASPRCVLGGYIIKFLRDYNDLSLSEMNDKTLAELYREEF